MSCHTWFSRPLTIEEFNLMKDYAPTEIYNLTGDTKQNIECGMNDIHLYNKLMKSYNENIPCVYGKYWWELGYGSGNLKSSVGLFNINKSHKLYIKVNEYTDTFRISTYPNYIIRNRRELRKYLRKRYFSLTNDQLQTISKFFKEYPNGIITFG